MANLPLYYKESYGLGPGVINNLELKYSQVGLSFGLWLFSDVAFVEPFHFGKRKGVHHLCGFAQVAVDRGQEEFDLLGKHFAVLWRHAKHVQWRDRRAAG